MKKTIIITILITLLIMSTVQANYVLKNDFSSYTGNDAGIGNLDTNDGGTGTNFLANGTYNLGVITARLKTTGTPTKNIVAEVWTNSANLPQTKIATSTNSINPSLLSTSLQEVNFTFDGSTILSNGEQYWVTFHTIDYSFDNSNFVIVDGQVSVSGRTLVRNDGSTWSLWSANWALGLKVYADNTTFYGVNHNYTYYNNEVAYFYQFNNITNQGYEQKNLSTGITNTSDCLSNYCYNGTFEHEFKNKTMSEYTNFTIAFWFTGNLNQTSSIDGVELENWGIIGESGITEYLRLGINNDGEIGVELDLNNDSILIDTNIVPNTNIFNHLALTYDGTRILLWLNGQEIYNTTEHFNFMEEQYVTGTDVRFNTNNQLFDDFFFIDRALYKNDVEQLMYWTENNIDVRLYAVLPPINVTIYSVCDETITLATNITEQRTFNWSEANDLQGLTITYGVKINSLYIINDTLETTFDYNFTTPPFVNAQYTSFVQACNIYECESDSCTFNVCISNWEAVYGQCLDNNQLLTYTDSNNCPIAYNQPLDNNTYVYCVNPDLEAELEARENNLYVIIILVFIVLLAILQILNISRILSFASIIINIILISTLFFMVSGNMIILCIGLLLLQIGLIFYLLTTSKN